MTIGGNPDVTDWAPTEETREETVVVTITNPDGSTVTEEVVITIIRDTDGDGNPDITDPDDDNDGYTDVEEEAAGTDPKDANSHPSEVVPPVDEPSQPAEPTAPVEPAQPVEGPVQTPTASETEYPVLVAKTQMEESKTKVDGASIGQLPNTGSEMNTSLFGAALAFVTAGFGLVIGKKKNKQED